MGDLAEVWVGLQRLWDGQHATAYRIGEPHPLYPFLTRYRTQCPVTPGHRRLHRAADRDGWGCHSCGVATLDLREVDWRLDARGELVPFKGEELVATLYRRVHGDSAVSCKRCASGELARAGLIAAVDDPLLARRAKVVARIVMGEPLERVAGAFGVDLQTVDLWYRQYFEHDRLTKAPGIYWRASAGSPVPSAWVLGSWSAGQVQLSVSCAHGGVGNDHRRLHKVAERSDWACHYCRAPLLDYPDITWVASAHPRRAPQGYAACVTLVASRPELEWQMASIDHVVPRAEGGLSTISNTVAACRRCNAGKGAQPAAWWVAQLAGLTEIPDAG